MNFLRRWILGKKLVSQLEQKALQTGIRYAVQGGKIVTPSDNKESYIKEAYSVNDIIYSVVNMVMDKVRLPEWGLYKVVDESSLKQSRVMLSNKYITGKDYKKAIELKYSSLEPINRFNLRQGKLKSLLEYPNEDETFQDLTANSCGFKMLTGDIFQWGEILKAGANSGIPNTIHNLPSHFTIINSSDGFPLKELSYELTVFNQKFTRQEVLHEKYWNPNWSSSGDHLYGMAALKAAMRNTRRNNSAKDASIAKFDNGGVEEVWYFDDPRFTPEQGLQQLNAMKIRLAEEYSGAANQGKRVLSGLKVGIEKSGMSPVELGIIDSEKWDAIMFCNVWGVPPELLGLVAKTYNNVKEAEKALTTRSAIPLLNSRRNSFNRKIQTDWGFKGENIYCDYKTECFGELQVDMNEAMTAISQLTMRTPNEEREAIGWEARPEPEADEVWVKGSSGMMPLSDFQANIVDQALNNEANRIEQTGKEGVSNAGKVLSREKKENK